MESIILNYFFSLNSAMISYIECLPVVNFQSSVNLHLREALLFLGFDPLFFPINGSVAMVVKPHSGQ